MGSTPAERTNLAVELGVTEVAAETRKLALAAVLVAVGVMSANVVALPIGFAKCFPVQHALNVIFARHFGRHYGVTAAFCVSTLRILLGTGSLLAYPGSMVGAALAGLLYSARPRLSSAIAGELLGTGVVGSLLACPIARVLMGTDAGAFFFVVPFVVSSVGGCALAALLSRSPLGKQLKVRS